MNANYVKCLILLCFTSIGGVFYGKCATKTFTEFLLWRIPLGIVAPLIKTKARSPQHFLSVSHRAPRQRSSSSAALRAALCRNTPSTVFREGENMLRFVRTVVLCIVKSSCDQAAKASGSSVAAELSPAELSQKKLWIPSVSECVTGEISFSYNSAKYQTTRKLGSRSENLRTARE